MRRRSWQERKWAADATLEYERKIATKRAEVERKLQQETAEQNANMKRSGFASIMLASNAMGAGIPFPLARILSAQFPGLTNMISGFIGLAGAGVGLKVIVEIFDRITHKIEEAAQKEQAYTEAVQRTKMVIGEADAASQLRIYRAEAGLAAAQNDKPGQARFKGMGENAEAIKQTADAVAKLAEAELKEARAAQDRMRTWDAVGTMLHGLFTGDSQLGVEKINDEMASFAREFSLRSVQDQINATHTAADFLAQSMQNAKDKLDALKAPDLANLADSVTVTGFEAPTKGTGGTAEQIAAAEKLVKLYKDIADTEKLRQEAAAKEHDKDVAEAAKQKGDAQLRATKAELQAIDKLVNSLRDRAGAEALAAEATGKGSAASIQAAAAAMAAKDISDRLADAGEKFKLGDITAAQFEKVKSALDAAAPAIRAFALAVETSKAQGEFNRALAEFNQRTREHIATLDAEAAGTGRVAAEQAKQAEAVSKLQDLYEGLYGKGAPAARPAIGPASLQQAAYEGLQGAKDSLGQEQNKTQAAWFAAELKKVQAAALEASDPSPWNRTEAKLAELKVVGSLTAAQMMELSAAMHFADASGALQKLVDKVADLRGAHAAMLSGSPYPALEAEAIKLAIGLSPDGGGSAPTADHRAAARHGQQRD